MPLYEYRCQSCAHRFERIRKFSDPPLVECPSCGGEVEKLLSSPAIRFKGSGFYITDYPNKSGAPEKPSESKPSSEAEKAKPDSTKGESATKSAADAGSSKSKDSGTSGDAGAKPAAKSESTKPSS